MATVLLCLAFLIFGVIFVSLLYSQKQEEHIDLFYEMTQREKGTLLRQVQKDWETLNGVAILMGYMDVSDEQGFSSVLAEINRKNEFIRMGVIGLDGAAGFVDVKGSGLLKVDLSQEPFFKRALMGEFTISDVMKDPFGEGYIFYLGVPLYRPDGLQGVLCAVHEAENMRIPMEHALYHGSGVSYLLGQNGAPILSVSDKREPCNDLLPEAEELGALLNGSVNFIEFQQEGEQLWAVSLPVGVNGWRILNILPMRTFDSDYQAVMGAILIIASALFIFIFFVFHMNRLAAKSKQQLERLAYFDPLTGEANQTKFLMELKEVIKKRPEDLISVWYCDIDNFKFFNELFGYSAGDKALCGFSDLLRANMGPEDLFCRISADDFAGVRIGCSKEDLKAWFLYLSAQMGQYMASVNQNYRITLSMGIYQLQDASTALEPIEMINRANMAHNSIKNSINEKCTFYADSIRQKVLFEISLESIMQKSLEAGEFKLYVQPKVDIQHGNQISGGEALVRWKSEEYGLISPGDFIPLFERDGFIIKLDRYMFRSACLWLKKWLKKGGKAIRLSVNVSRLGLVQEDFLSYYIDTKREIGIPDGILELEFTESLALDDTALFRQRILALQEAGFICSLDDFGSGYSSLNILRELPIQVLKLDMLFFQRGSDQQRARIVVSNVIRMARQLQIETVSEGVEETSQVAFLRGIGCDLVQGYVFSKPVPLDVFETMLEKPAF